MINNPVGEYSTVETKSGLKWWAWAGIILGICCCLGLIGTVGFFAYFGREPENISLEYQMPQVVKMGENFDFVLKITNTGSESFMVGDIDLDETLGGSILDGSVVLDTEPPMERDYSVSGIKTFYYNQTVQPGETKTITFHLQATTVGEFGGSVAAYIGDLSKRIDYVGLIVQE